MLQQRQGQTQRGTSGRRCRALGTRCSAGGESEAAARLTIDGTILSLAAICKQCSSQRHTLASEWECDQLSATVFGGGPAAQHDDAAKQAARWH